MKYIKYLILLLIVFTISLVVFTKKDNNISIVVPKHNFLQVINDNEVVRVPFLVNSSDSFITNITMINSVTLSNDLVTIPIILEGIYEQNYTINYKETDYNAFMLDFYIDQDEISIDLEDAILNIEYNDNSVLELPIGNVNLITGNIKDFDVVYMDSKSSYLEDYYTVSEVVLGIIPKYDLTLAKININSKDFYVNNKNITISNVYKETNHNDYIDLSKSIENNELDLFLKKDELYYINIPINYVNKEYLFRFYLEVITDKSNNQIDDFLYLNQGYFPSFIFDNVTEINLK